MPKKSGDSGEDIPVAGGGATGAAGVGGAASAVTFTETEPDFVGSATLAAVTVSTPALEGAVYCPADVIIPREAFHVTAVLDAVPWTLAANESLPDVIEDAVAGDIVTEVTVTEVSAKPVVDVRVAVPAQPVN
jgi:hypothetical protein